MNKEDILKRIEDAKEKVTADLKSLFDGLKYEVSKWQEEAEKAAEAAAEAAVAERLEEATDKAWRDGYERAMKDVGQFQGGGASEGAEPSTAQTETDAQTEPVAEYCLTNERVAAFMADPAYNVAGFACSDGKSVVDKYCVDELKNKYAENWIEHPNPVVTAKGTYWNLIPGRTYTKDGITFRTTGTVRQIHFPDADQYVSNCRDLGGYACEGGHVEYGKLIRSAYLPDGLTKTSSVAKVLRDEVGVTYEIDFRGVEPNKTLGWGGVKLFINGYADVLTKTTNYKALFGYVLQELEKGGCVLLHCFAGADRTGTAVPLFLGVLGVEEADLVKDWELTSFCHWENFKIISQWAERVADPEKKAIALKEFPKGELREFFQAMKATFGKNGESFQQQAVAFWKKVGVTTKQLNRFKELMIVKC